MDRQLLDQARSLHSTIKALQRRVFLGNMPKSMAGHSSAHELSMSQLTTLLVVHDRPEMSLKEIAEATHVSPPSASSMVDRLVELRMVTRRNSDVDRREIRIGVTPEGLATVQELEGELLKSVVEILENIGPDYAARWCEVYERIQQYLDQEKIPDGVRRGPVEEGVK